MHLSGFSGVPMVEAALANLAKSPSLVATSLRNSRFGAQFQAYSSQCMAKLYASNHALPGATAKIRLQLAHLQGKLMTQLHGHFSGPAYHGVAFDGLHRNLGGFNPGFSLPWGGRFSGAGTFYHSSGLNLHWNGVNELGIPCRPR